jgi:hypothetical protein
MKISKQTALRKKLRAEEKLEMLVLKGVNSGDPITIGPTYWDEKHRRLDEKLRRLLSYSVAASQSHRGRESTLLICNLRNAG